MRLCYLADPASMHTQRWVCHFANAGHEVHLINWGPPPAQPLNWRGTTHHDLGVPATASPPGLRWAMHFTGRMRALRELLREIQPDLLHAHYISGPGWLAAQAGFHPLVMSAWGTDILLGLHHGPVRERLTLRYALRQADLLTADARQVLDMARPYLGRNSQAALIRFGVDTRAFCPGPNALWRNRLGLGSDPVILSARQCRAVYNIDTILRAFVTVRLHVPQARLLIKLVHQAPGDSYVAKIEATVAEWKLSEAVTFVPWVAYADIPDLYRAADVVVSVPSSDGMPVSVLEAMACGVPVVASSLPALHELAAEGADLPLVPARDAGALSDMLVHLLTSPERRAAIARQNLETVRRTSDWALEMDRTEALYRGLVEGDAP